MRAYVFTGYGDSSAMELREVDAPSPGPGQVQIQVRAAGLNPIDYKTRQGSVRLINRLVFPAVAGNELAGVVSAVGSGVSRFSTGDRVYARVDKSQMGAFAEYAVVAEDLLAAMPSSLTFEQAAGVPLAGLTALQALRDELAVAKGSKIFISGGAGGVGTFAIQLAKWLGAEVATTASVRGAELTKRLGADVIVDYTTEKFDDLLHGYDGAFELIGGETLDRAFRILKPGAKIVSVAGRPEPATARLDLKAGILLTALFWAISIGTRRKARRRGITYRYLLMHPSGDDLTLLAGLLDSGKLEVVLDRTFAFQDIAEAMTYLESGRAKGKIVVTLEK
ncbi:NADP-dependent oxidoreductase [Fodinicola feengrottensis]|uniref:NADP-dependent oxidoreductase n=1 Tax=Fodinicola feengrottensis TaxID=435914 RepID=A0ABN2IDW6_9ACTN|nr:NADP-dependent oxidoreductase [Fodinicola feengrottensis]